MDQRDFLARMEEIDDEFAARDLPIHARPLHALPLLIGGYSGPIFPLSENHAERFSPFEGPNLLKSISDWYSQRYGDRVNMPTDLAKVPVVIRRQIYLLRIPLVFGRPRIDAMRLVEGMTDGMKMSLGRRDLQEIATAFTEGFALTYEVEDVRRSLPQTAIGAGEFFEAAIRDRDTAARCLTGPHPDLNSGCFHAQQHAEKMLKGFLLAKCGETKESLRRGSHDLNHFYALAVAGSTDLTELAHDIGLLANIKMDIRYMEVQVPIEAAVAAVWAALRVGGAVACASFGRPRRRSWSVRPATPSSVPG